MSFNHSTVIICKPDHSAFSGVAPKKSNEQFVKGIYSHGIEPDNYLRCKWKFLSHKDENPYEKISSSMTPSGT